ncbi:NAD(P)H-dependent oxidoreductase [Granulosicoccaceae sp. 1_MG-2023]|nr:NAD(P)H-dependent oxidoreductase [Granulosicoccaceae sp. 1_MG-2023]
MKTLLIVYHSMTGGTQQMCEAVREGAEGAGEALRVRLLRAAGAGPEDLMAADGYVFATPENLAAIAGLMKDFFDRSYYPVLDRLNGRPVCLLVCAGSDGQQALAQMQRICTGWRLREVLPSRIVCTKADTEAKILAPKQISEAELAACRELGETLASGLAMGIF